MVNDLERVNGVEPGHGVVAVGVVLPLETALLLVAKPDGVFLPVAQVAGLVRHPDGNHVARRNAGGKRHLAGEIFVLVRRYLADVGIVRASVLGGRGIPLREEDVVGYAAGSTGQFGDLLVRLAVLWAGG